MINQAETREGKGWVRGSAGWRPLPSTSRRVGAGWAPRGAGGAGSGADPGTAGGPFWRQ